MAIEPDTKDWTWVLTDPCPECGFDPKAVDVSKLPELIHENTRGWYGALDDADAAVRPSANIWSRLEYACHVRDVHVLFAERARLMLEQDDPQFANWDQDVTAIESRYDEQDPAEVSVALVEAAAEMAAVYAGVRGDQWQRVGRRSNGSVFTVETLGIYYLHDVVHHLYDIGGPAAGSPAAP
ncbi:DinB family protein [Nocardioides marmorisolisilvae]|uniref:DinB family protein n=1 Tax=Nocardioides marmorisolisilvae TaxID=1542737 RepID=A0A3N0DS06_9ACTN|nr:DinB family protein [Nocardioides marmorisolisilvae]RNL78418.1 DinB family protein [Nocardioides marmorisolisilvae]